MRQGVGKVWLCSLVVAAMLGVFSSGVKAEETEAKGWEVTFHGFAESNVVIRDQNGIQDGFMDHLDAIQQRNTLKFDVDVSPSWVWGDFSVQKFHLTYRGAYDSIFDLRQGAYGDIDNKGGPSRFDYGKRDIRFENDLREAFVDLAYQGPLGAGFFRPGRQLVSWGEVSGATILDIINPPDNSFQMFFQNPDDLKIPLWMGRLNYTMPSSPAFGLNFDFLFIPDIRPSQFGPLDHSMEAPYVSITSLRRLAPFNVRQDVPTDKREYGVKVGMQFWDKLAVSLVYLRDVVNDPALKLTDFVFIGGRPVPTTALLTHPTQHVYGFYFSYALPLNIMLRGEFGRQTRVPISGGTLAPVTILGQPILPFGPKMEVQTYRLKPVTQWMLGLDKSNFWVKWLFPHDPVSIGVQWIHKTINSWEHALDIAENSIEPESISVAPTRNQDFFTFNASSYWWSGKLNPSVFFIYSPEGGGEGGGTWMARGSLAWTMTTNWYSSLSAQAFLGNKEAKSSFAGLVRTSEVTFKIGYQW